MYYALCVLIGLILGFIIGGSIKGKKNVATGTFYINSSDPDKDIFTVDLDNVDDIYKADWIMMHVERDYTNKRK